MKKKTNLKTDNTDTLLKLYQIYDNHRNAILWFLEELEANDYKEYLERYSGASSERSHFIAVCGFFELLNNKRLSWTKKRRNSSRSKYLIQHK